MVCPSFPRSSTLPRRPFLVEAPLLTVGRVGLRLLAHAVIRYSSISIPKPLIFLSHKHVASLWAERILARKPSRPLSLSSSAGENMEGIGAYERAQVDYEYKQHREERDQSI
jgi:hypothetical protein